MINNFVTFADRKLIVIELKTNRMKKILLSVMSLLVATASVNAQTVATDCLSDFGKVAFSEAQCAATTHSNDAPTAFATPTAKPFAHRVATRATEADLEYLMVEGADIPVGSDGFPDAPDVNAVFGRITADKLQKYAGYTVAGVAFIVSADLGEQPMIIAMETRDNTVETVAGGNIEKYVVTSPEEGITLNEVGAQYRYELPAEPHDIFFGYTYTQKQTGTNADKPLMVGSTTDLKNGYFALGTLGSNGRQLYRISQEKFPYALCVQLILLKDDETVLLGVDGSEQKTVTARFAADGTRLAAPTRGLNIERLSDGTTRKVWVSR